MKWLEEGTVLETLQETRYIDNFGEETIGELNVLKSGDDIGFGVTNVRKVLVSSWEEAVKIVDGLLKRQMQKLKNLYPNSKIGYRGSLATGTKYSTGGPFDPTDWDVDAFIVSDELAAKFPANVRFRNAKEVDAAIKSIGEDLEASLKKINGYRFQDDKPLAFRVYTEIEFNTVVKSNGSKIFQ
ncbi:hypothetical protein [Flagellimonas lutimaris]|uniref:hypothetical protein n=1 Tax=Flagellimonas lutimaris TaxID=475082 RepID=UPI003F5CE448